MTWQRTSPRCPGATIDRAAVSGRSAKHASVSGILTPSATLPPRDTLGCTTQRLLEDRELRCGPLKLHRKRSEGSGLGRVELPACDRGFLVGVSLSAGHRRHILQPRHGSRHVFGDDAIYIRRFDEDYCADLDGAFDFMLIELAPALFDDAMDERSGRRIAGLAGVTGLPDPVLASLARALQPALARPREASRLFIEQIGQAVATHLVEHYGDGVALARRARRGLSPAQAAKAREMLRARLDGDVSIGEVAAACSLSRAHFSRAFRETVGQTPHQWLTGQRIEHARGLLRLGSLPLAEVASACGFADQSHFTRVFSAASGCTPGAWRRRAEA